MPVAGEFVAGVVDYIVHEEKQHRDHKRGAESTLADDRAERRADEEEDYACHRQSEFLDQLDLVTAESRLLVVELHGAELDLAAPHLHGVCRRGECGVKSCLRQRGEK